MERATGFWNCALEKPARVESFGTVLDSRVLVRGKEASTDGSRGGERRDSFYYFDNEQPVWSPFLSNVKQNWIVQDSLLFQVFLRSFLLEAHNEAPPQNGGYKRGLLYLRYDPE